jgi:hypothetical protein
MKEHYPNWDITKSLEDVFHDIYNRYMEAWNYSSQGAAGS